MAFMEDLVAAMSTEVIIILSFCLKNFRQSWKQSIITTGFMETVPNCTLEVTRWSISKISHNYNQPRIVSTQTKLKQKVDHFTVFESFPSTSCNSHKFLPNKMEKLVGWTCEIASGMFTLGEWRDGLAGKRYNSKLWSGTSEAQKPAWRDCVGSLMAEMKHNLH